MEELKDGIVYGNLGDLNFKLTTETLLEIIDAFTAKDDDDCDDDYDDDDGDDCDDECIEDIFNDLKNGSHCILAFKYDNTNDKNCLDRRDYIGKCIGIFESGAEAERELELSRGCSTRIANTWQYAVNHNNTVGFELYATTDGWTSGQWTTNSFLGKIMFCYGVDAEQILKADKSKNSLFDFYL